MAALEHNNPQLVVVGVVEHNGLYLLSQRPPGRPHAGFWEFPGGKVEAGESHEKALARELFEEVGIVVKACAALIQINTSFINSSVCLEVFLVKEFSGQIQGREGQALQWLSLENCLTLHCLPSTPKIVIAIQKSRQHCVITQGD